MFPCAWKSHSGYAAIYLYIPCHKAFPIRELLWCKLIRTLLRSLTAEMVTWQVYQHIQYMYLPKIQSCLCSCIENKASVLFLVTVLTSEAFPYAVLGSQI